MNQQDTRTYWVHTMLRIAGPVLDALSQRQLHAVMPVERRDFDRSPYAHLEAFGRTLCGIAPWLEAQQLDPEEAALQASTLQKVLLCIDAATDPASPDRMNFSGQPQAQPLVDAAFFAEGLLRAPHVLIDGLEPRVKQNVIDALKESRSLVPNSSNWILFSAMVEAGLFRLGCKDFDMVRIQYGLRQFMQWYKGDGFYGDGEDFHMDYYNSFVIQPMLVDLVRVFQNAETGCCFGGQDFFQFADKYLARATRHAAVLERMISPEGTYPVVGRSVTYRFGAFHALAQAAQLHLLDERLAPAQVRSALTAVIQRVMSAPDLFDENGWLRLGVYGHQVHLAEQYICTGSLYLCCAVFLPLGLAPSDPFWAGENTPWTSQRIWSGEDLPEDHFAEI